MKKNIGRYWIFLQNLLQIWKTYGRVFANVYNVIAKYHYNTLFLPKRKILERINSRAVLQPIERKKQKFKFPVRNTHEVSTKHASLKSKTDVYLFLSPTLYIWQK